MPLKNLHKITCEIRDAEALFSEQGNSIHFYSCHLGSRLNIRFRPGPNSDSDSDLSEILSIHVPEKYRRQGLAKKIISRAFKDHPNLSGNFQTGDHNVIKLFYSFGMRYLGAPKSEFHDIIDFLHQKSSVKMARPGVNLKENIQCKNQHM